MSLAQNQINALKEIGFSIQEIQNGIMKKQLLSLRDEFAMSAKHSDLGLPSSIERIAEYIGISKDAYMLEPKQNWLKAVCKARYEYADAMMEARNG